MNCKSQFMDFAVLALNSFLGIRRLRFKQFLTIKQKSKLLVDMKILFSGLLD